MLQNGSNTIQDLTDLSIPIAKPKTGINSTDVFGNSFVLRKDAK